MGYLPCKNRLTSYLWPFGPRRRNDGMSEGLSQKREATSGRVSPPPPHSAPRGKRVARASFSHLPYVCISSILLQLQSHLSHIPHHYNHSQCPLPPPRTHPRPSRSWRPSSRTMSWSKSQVRSSCCCRRVGRPAGPLTPDAGIDVDGVLRGKVMSKSKFLSAAKSDFGFCGVVFGWDCEFATRPTLTSREHPKCWAGVVVV